MDDEAYIIIVYSLIFFMNKFSVIQLLPCVNNYYYIVTCVCDYSMQGDQGEAGAQGNINVIINVIITNL